MILDAGCGRGWMSFIFSYYKNKVVATDLSLIQLQRARNLFSSGIKFTLINSNLEYLPFKDNIFDIIVCCDVLEHTKHPLLVLNEFYRTLKKDGYLLLTVPGLLYSIIYDKIFFWLWKEKLIKNKIIPYLSIGDYQYHQYLFTKKRLINLLKKSKFQITNFYNLSFLGYFMTTMGNLIRNSYLTKMLSILIEIDFKLSRFLPNTLGTSWILRCSRL